MASTINEYPLTDPKTVVNISYSAQPLEVYLVDDVPTLCVRADSGGYVSERGFFIYATGATIGDGSISYVGSYVDALGARFFVFERDPSADP